MTEPMTVGEAYEKMPPGLLDCLETCQVFPPPLPRTLGGWLRVMWGTLLCDVLRRCHHGGCWHRARYQTLLVGRLCSRHYGEYYGMGDA